MEYIVLDKTADGKYWTLEGWLSCEWGVRLRFSHTNYEDPSTLQAEVGRWNQAESLTTWEPIGTPFEFWLGAPDDVPEAEWAEDFPSDHREACVELGRLLGRLSRHCDLGPALGGLREDPRPGP